MAGAAVAATMAMEGVAAAAYGVVKVGEEGMARVEGAKAEDGEWEVAEEVAGDFRLLLVGAQASMSPTTLRIGPLGPLNLLCYIHIVGTLPVG